MTMKMKTLTPAMVMSMMTLAPTWTLTAIVMAVMMLMMRGASTGRTMILTIVVFSGLYGA